MGCRVRGRGRTGESSEATGIKGSSTRKPHPWRGWRQIGTQQCKRVTGDAVRRQFQGVCRAARRKSVVCGGPGNLGQTHASNAMANFIAATSQFAGHGSDADSAIASRAGYWYSVQHGAVAAVRRDCWMATRSTKVVVIGSWLWLWIGFHCPRLLHIVFVVVYSGIRTMTNGQALLDDGLGARADVGLVIADSCRVLRDGGIRSHGEAAALTNPAAAPRRTLAGTMRISTA